MKRLRLVWFASGLATGVLLCGVASWLTQRAPQNAVYLRLTGSGFDLDPRAFRERVQLKANPYQPWLGSLDARKRVTASILEEAVACGGREFAVDMPTHGFDLVVELKPETVKTVNCLIVAASKNGIPFVISDSLH